MQKKNKVVNLSKKAFLSAVIVLLVFMVVATVLTYVLPKGQFAQVGGVVDYNQYQVIKGAKGINLFKAIFSPILIFVSDGMLQPIVLAIFILVISGVFQAMFDCGGMQEIVARLVNKFKNKKFLFLAILTLFFMSLGSFFGLFEETLILLPMVVSICVGLGYNASIGFLVCSFATGIGFSVAITNPFTIVYSSDLIGASITKGIWFRLLAFAIFYALLLLVVWFNAKKTTAQLLKPEENATTQSSKPNKKLFLSWTIFLVASLFSIILFTSIPMLRDIATPLIVVVFLIGGFIAGTVTFGFKNYWKSFGKGVVFALPAIAMICLAFAIKYILVEGLILDTITNYIATSIHGKSKYITVLLLFAIILILEFFISSSTAKAVFVMGILSGVASSNLLSISAEMLVLIYIFSDGFTNMLFPTSPCLLIGLSMTGQSYIDWLKKTKFLFPIIFALCVGLLMFATAIGY